MKAKHLLTIALLAVAFTAHAQKTLDIEDRTQSVDVYSSDGDEAAIIIRCDESIPLEFSSSMDKHADPFRVETQGSDKVYYIAFPTGNRYRGRQLTINSPGYNEYVIDLGDMQPKRLYTFYLSDPNATVGKGCYIEHRNKAQAEIKAMNYDQAQLILEESQQCSDVDTAELRQNLQLVDSLIYYRQLGEQAYRTLDYSLASDYFDKVMSFNPYDTYASSRYSTCVSRYTVECNAMFNRAETFFENKEYDKARELYADLAGRNFSMSSSAQQRLKETERAITKKKEHARVITYEWRKDTPIGFSFGKYNRRRVGGFFQFDLSNKVFDAMRSECNVKDKKFAEMNIAAGWAIHIWGPLWVHFGPGFTGKLYYGTYKDGNYPMYEKHELEPYQYPTTWDYNTGTEIPVENLSQEDKDKVKKKADTKANVAFAVSPVVGITAKYSYFSLRLTYQYRFSFKSELDDFVNKQRFSIGIGVSY